MDRINIRNLLSSFAIGAAIGAVAMNMLKKPEIRQEIREVEVVKNNIRTIVKTVERPDGTKTTVSETIDQSASKQTKNETLQINLQKNWIAGIGASTDYKLSPNYSASVSRRILGPIFVGASANTKAEIGVQVLIEF